MRRLPLATLALPLALLAGCGTQTALKPKPGQQLPKAPYGRNDRPGSVELLTPGPQARPNRNVELRVRSETRTDDPFDLPPQG